MRDITRAAVDAIWKAIGCNRPATTGSPIQPSASEAIVIPSWVAEMKDVGSRSGAAQRARAGCPRLRQPQAGCGARKPVRIPNRQKMRWRLRKSTAASLANDHDQRGRAWTGDVAGQQGQKTTSRIHPLRVAKSEGVSYHGAPRTSGGHLEK